MQESPNGRCYAVLPVSARLSPVMISDSNFRTIAIFNRLVKRANLTARKKLSDFHFSQLHKDSQLRRNGNWYPSPFHPILFFLDARSLILGRFVEHTRDRSTTKQPKHRLVRINRAIVNFFWAAFHHAEVIDSNRCDSNIRFPIRTGLKSE